MTTHIEKTLQTLLPTRLPIALAPMAGVTDLPFRVICRELGAGIVNEAAITARKVLEAALDCNAVRVALAHNHVSGVAMYSNADVRATRELRALLRQVNIELVDHFVLANDDMVSMAESGALAEKSDD